jgi:ABC-type multidrug transport system, ATPase and permease components
MLNYFKELWQRIKHRKALMLVVLFTSIGSTVCFLMLPLIIQSTLDNQISSLTANPWYSTTTENGIAIGDNYLTQDINLATKTSPLFRVVYNEDTPCLIDNIINAEQTLEIHDSEVYDFNGEKLVNSTIYELQSEDIQKLYAKNRDGLNNIIRIFFILILIHPIFAWLNNVAVRKFAREIIADFRIAGMKKLQKLPIDYFTKRQDGKFISYLISDVSMFYSIAANIGMQLLQAFIMFIGIYVLLFTIDTRLFLGAIIFLPIVAFWMYTFRNKIITHYENARHSQSSLNALLSEQFKGISVIRAFNYSKEAENEFAELNNAVYSHNERSLKVRSYITGPLVNILRRTLWVFVLIYAGSLYFNQSGVGLTIGTIYLLVSLVNSFVEPLYQFFSIITTIEQANVSIQRYFRYMNEEEETEKPKATATALPRFTGRVRFENLSFGYNPEQKVLKNINIDIAPHKSVAIVGHTGSGKSSLMNLLMRFYEYTDGKILVDDYEITDMTRNVYREHIGIILQDPILFKGTLFEAITWGDEKFSKDEVAELLQTIGAGEILEHPEGLMQPVVEMGANFSLGQRQLLAFARAIIQNPSILILDEATANIDTETERKIQNALAIAAQNRTTFVIAHRLSTIQHSDLIIVLDKGEIIEQGTHEELIVKGGTYWEMYQAQGQKQQKAINLKQQKV